MKIELLNLKKQCYCCNIEKDISDFHKRKLSRDGRATWCKLCAKKHQQEYHRQNKSKSTAYAKEYRLNNYERLIKYDRLRSKTIKRKQLHKECDNRYRKIHLLKYKAITAAGNAIRDKKLVKKTHCERCGKKTRLHKHHEDYSRPLQIVWLCQPCHILRHKEIQIRSAI